jgi:RHS repeat-associated protein
MTESGKGEKYVYDGFGRLREVHDWVETAPSTWGWRIHAAYRYNGLGMRLTHEINVDNDADIDGSDVKTYFAYDERWRVVGTYASPTAAGPTERWVHHAAGLAGSGGSSYIDSVVLRDRDVVLSGTGSSYGGDALEERVYVLQNWRADVVATLGRTGTLIEWIQYTPYGMAVTNPPGNADFNGDGGVDGGDTEAFFLAWEGGLPSADINNDGAVDLADIAAFDDIWEAGETPQAGLCMLTAIRVGYAGYQWDGSVNNDRTVSGTMAGLYHVRHRVYDPELGRWTRRDPIGYVDGVGLYEYARGIPNARVDSSGERSQALKDIVDDLRLIPRLVWRNDLPIPGTASAIEWCKKHDPDVIRMLGLLGAKAPPCPIPNVVWMECSNPPNTQKENRKQGWFDCSEITLCSNSKAGEGIYSACKVFAHELQHAFDKCSGFRQSGSCKDEACLELRASNLSGQCCLGSPYRLPGDSYKSCVLRYAFASLQATRNTRGRSECERNDVGSEAAYRDCLDVTASPCGPAPR